MKIVLKTPPWSLPSTSSGETPFWPSERFKPMASNQKVAWQKARDALRDAERAGMKGKDLEILRAAEAARRAELESASGTSAENAS